ncbi:hypothetical protein NP603_04085 [Methylomonas sp. SURF-1]|uniref:Uncharacterized protein n=1 Tax=Methylomonas aurea TaxID=2952224 RepID=A0ABT1UDG7_9GAMM|nr:hypothetical protein [Methylomonas sp. SURF-1]MCQ8180278.1 hypothetical protein [Methylomonas sp. SURF-1]
MNWVLGVVAENARYRSNGYYTTSVATGHRHGGSRSASPEIWLEIGGVASLLVTSLSPDFNKPSANPYNGPLTQDAMGANLFFYDYYLLPTTRPS